jgi:hypothetical protein
MTVFVRVSDTRLNLELNLPTILVVLDFSKVFNSVCQGLFIFKLSQRYGFYASAAAGAALFSSYLFSRHQCDRLW